MRKICFKFHQTMQRIASLCVLAILLSSAVSASGQTSESGSPGSGIKESAAAIAGPVLGAAMIKNGWSDTSGRISHLMLVVMTCLYLVQIFFAYSKAAREPKNASPRSILTATFGGQDELIRTWVSVATIMIFPTLLSWFLGFFHHGISKDNFANIVAYKGSVALLTTLVTVELTFFLDLRGEGDRWRSMLVISLALDVLSLFIFAAFIGGFVSDESWGNQDTYGAVFMTVMAAAACVSSFLIILFVKVANNYSAANSVPLHAQSGSVSARRS